MKSRKDISDITKRILIDYLSGTITEADAGTLRLWLEADHRNRILLNELRMIWDSSFLVKNRQVYDANQAWEDILTEISKKNERKTSIFTYWKSWIQIAALFVLVLSIGIFAGLNWKEKRPYQYQFTEIMTMGDSKVSLILTDGTEVWLNKDSRIYPSSDYGSKNRTIQLEGEAYFKVAENKKIPFNVHTSEVIITALGTAFNIRSYPEDNQIKTTLAEGAVLMTIKDSEKQAILKPDQMAIFQKGGNEFMVKDVTAAHYSLWKEPKWMIRKESIGNLADRLANRYGVVVNYTGEGLEKYAFSGTIIDEPLEEVLKMIRLTVPIDYKINEDTVWIQVDKKRQRLFNTLIH